MATEHQQRVLICGDVNGNFVNLLVRLEQILRKVTPFEMMLVCGEFFGADAEENLKIVNGVYRCPLPTYVLGPVKPEAARYYRNVSGEEIGHNLFYLGKKGLFTSASGLTVAYLSGFEATYEDEFHFSKDTVDRLLAHVAAQKSFAGVDVLLTSQWPLGVDNLSPVTPDVTGDEELRGSALVARLAATLKPRYHFAANTGCHFERPPYRNMGTVRNRPCHTTRFIGLSSCGNPSKLKYLFAFNILPLRHLPAGHLVEEPHMTTEFPYGHSLKVAEEAPGGQKTLVDDVKGNQFFFDYAAVEASRQDGAGSRKRQANETKHQAKQINYGPCWFCLSSQEVAKHLIISISDNAYLSLTKGGLCDDHFIISPIGHFQSIVCADNDVKDEVERYKASLKKYFEEQQKCVVFFERNYRTQHLQVHAVPLASNLAPNVRPCFMQIAANHSIEIVEIGEGVRLDEVVNAGCPYFYAELPYGQRLLVLRMRQFPVHFAREALTHKDLLNAPDKVDWHNCELSIDEETELALKFRRQFAKYDFSEVVVP